jgi:hypothetical protein
MASPRKRKANPTWETTIAGDDGDEIEVVVEYTVEGKYHPAKMYGDDAHPEEFPEYTIVSVMDGDGNEVPYDEDELIGDLEEYCNDKEASDKYDYEERGRD